MNLKQKTIMYTEEKQRVVEEKVKNKEGFSIGQYMNHEDCNSNP